MILERPYIRNWSSIMKSNPIQLFIIPYAGGSIASFKRMTELIDERIEVVTVEYPGRGTRIREPFADSIWSLFDDAVEYINMRRNKTVPYYLMGYSMGSVFAYEMLIQNKLYGELKHLFIAAEISPKNRALELRRVKCPTDDEILERARGLGGLDDRILADKSFRDIYIRPGLSDYRLFFDYRFKNHGQRIKVNTTVFYCSKDTEFDAVQEWEKLLYGDFDYHEMGKNHFFINSCYKTMAEVINDHLKKDLIGEVNDI